MANWVADHLAQHPDMAALPVYKRARHSLHLQRPDGLIVAQFTGAPCHYLDGTLGWQPLDTRLRQIGNEYGAPGLATRITLDGGVRLDKTAHRQRTVGFVILDALTGKVKSRPLSLPTGRLDGENVVREAGPFRHVARVTETGLQETLTIAQPLSGTSASEWAMLETQVVGHDWPDGWLDAAPVVKGIVFSPPTCIDAKDSVAPMRRYAKKEAGTQYLYTGVPLAWLAGASYPVVVDPDYTGSTSDGEVSGASTTYATARSTSTAANILAQYMYLGQSRVLVSKAYTYTCYRAFLRFDTSSIGSGSTVTQVNLTLSLTSDNSDTDFDVQIIKQDWSGEVELTDTTGKRETAYDNCLSGTADDSTWRNTSGVSANTPYASGNLNNSWVSLTGNTYYSLISSRDVASTTPTGYEMVVVASQNNTTSGYRPFLTVTYTGGGGGASVVPVIMRSYRQRLT